MTRIHDGERLWHLQPATFEPATRLLVASIRPRLTIQHVVGIARGGVHVADAIAAHLGCTSHSIRASHNRTDAVRSATLPEVVVDLHQLPVQVRGTLLVVDDIVGSGATLLEVTRGIRACLPAVAIHTAALCLNAGGTHPPDFFVWSVRDWVVFPWEPPPTEAQLQPLVLPTSAQCLL